VAANFRLVDTRFNGEALGRARAGKGLTHHQLAAIVNLRLGEQILDLERGISEPNPRLILALAEALTIHPIQLLVMPNGIDLRALRLGSGLGAAEVARAAHVSVRSYLRWESGEDLPMDNPRILWALAQRLDASRAQISQALNAREVQRPTRHPATGDSLPHPCDNDNEPTFPTTPSDQNRLAPSAGHKRTSSHPW
jgi:transcriptional regulator with XRE-family HTH domain